MFVQQIQGVINVSLPVIALCGLFPALPGSFTGRFLCAVLIGLYVCFLNWTQIKNLQTTLKHSPTDAHKDLFRDLIKECNIDPDSIVLRYAYTNESIGLTSGNTVIIDPLAWSNLDGDPEAIKVKNIFKDYIQSTLSISKKERIAAVATTLTPGAQRFIFKHEVGHVIHNFSHKSLVTIFVIGFLAAYIGVTAAMTLPLEGFIAGLAGMAVGGVSDLLLTFTSNFFWRTREEQKADLFAAQNSSYEDIIEAADFFSQHQKILNANPEPQNLLAYVPSSMRTGHPNAIWRSAYLKELAKQKQLQ